MDRIALPLAQANQVLIRTLKSLGYDSETAELGAWSAIWLEQRREQGVNQLIVYMMLAKDLAFDDLKPRRHEEYGITGICPFMLASFLASNEERLMSRGKVALGAPASPMLFAPAIADLMSHVGKSLRITHHNYSCLFSNEGVQLGAETFGLYGMVTTDDNGPMVLEVTEQKGFGLRQLASIELPRTRLDKSGLLNLS